LYRDLASQEKDPNNKKTLDKLAQQEHEHYLFWRKFLPSYQPMVSPFFLLCFRMIRRLLGLTFTIKLLERHEHGVVEEYKKVAAELSGDEKSELERINDEEEHETFLLVKFKKRWSNRLALSRLG